MDFSAPDYDELLKRYLDVCNQALVLNKNRFPFKQILGAAEKSEIGRVIEVNVLDISVQASYAMSISKDGIVAEPHSDCPDCKCERTWKVTKDYLEDVADNPAAYIENPAKLDWEWLYDVPER